jgi:hypothetical protein
MDTVFLSYTFNPHPDYQDETEKLVTDIKIIAECQELRVFTGVDLGGGPLGPEIQQRIMDCDALVALFTPWKDKYNNPAIPPYVNDEYTFAVNKGKQAIRLLHTVLNNQGMYANQEYILFDPQQPVDALLKLMRTLLYWKKKLGRAHEIQLLPPELVSGLINAGTNSRCEYQLLINRTPGQWNKTDIWPEPGGLVTYIPNVPEEAKFNLKVTLGNEQWHSRFCNPNSHSIRLEKLS